MVSYEYDSWGKLLSTGGTQASTVGRLNPFRYRGYCYDEETGFYYLNSRYYDPEVCRFINADVYACTGQSVLGYNMFAYCLNNPVNFIDTSGERAQALAKIWVQSMGWLVLADGPIPLGDIIYCVTAVGLMAVARIGGKYVRVSNQAAKAHAEIKSKVKKSSKTRYWTATIKKGYVDIGRGLTYSQAVKEVAKGNNVFAVTKYEAKVVAIAAGGKSKDAKNVINEIDKGKKNVPGHYYHYHTYNRQGGHVFYLF